MSKGKVKEVAFSLSPFPGGVRGEEPLFLTVSAAPPLFIFSHCQPPERSHQLGPHSRPWHSPTLLFSSPPSLI